MENFQPQVFKEAFLVKPPTISIPSDLWKHKKYCMMFIGSCLKTQNNSEHSFEIQSYHNDRV